MHIIIISICQVYRHCAACFSCTPSENFVNGSVRLKYVFEWCYSYLKVSSPWTLNKCHKQHQTRSPAGWGWRNTAGEEIQLLGSKSWTYTYATHPDVDVQEIFQRWNQHDPHDNKLALSDVNVAKLECARHIGLPVSTVKQAGEGTLKNCLQGKDIILIESTWMQSGIERETTLDIRPFSTRSNLQGRQKLQKKRR